MRFAVVDVETSGLNARRHRILQVAVVTVLADGTVVDEWASYVRPHLRRVGPKHVHGLTVRALRDAPTFSVVAPELARRLEGAVFCAHNAAFDWGFVARGMRRAALPVPAIEQLCTLRLSRANDPDRVRSHRLADLCDRYGVPLTQAHDALADARATAAVLPHLLAEAALTPATLGPHLRRGRPAPSGPAWLRRLRQVRQR
jgi:DNA polymerase-3 subunit epsilon